MAQWVMRMGGLSWQRRQEVAPSSHLDAETALSDGPDRSRIQALPGYWHLDEPAAVASQDDCSALADLL
jgi:hypothetical protein